jgi:hypothetical protein
MLPSSLNAPTTIVSPEMAIAAPKVAPASAFGAFKYVSGTVEPASSGRFESGVRGASAAASVLVSAGAFFGAAACAAGTLIIIVIVRTMLTERAMRRCGVDRWVVLFKVQKNISIFRHGVGGIFPVCWVIFFEELGDSFDE